MAQAVVLYYRTEIKKKASPLCSFVVKQKKEFGHVTMFYFFLYKCN